MINPALLFQLLFKFKSEMAKVKNTNSVKHLKSFKNNLWKKNKIICWQ